MWIRVFGVFPSLCLHSWVTITIIYFQRLTPGYLPIHTIYTQSPILAWLLLALINVYLTLVSLETRKAGASEAPCIAMATASMVTWLWLTLINLDLTSDPCEHQSNTDVRGPMSLLHRLRAEGEHEQSFHVVWLWSCVDCSFMTEKHLSATVCHFEVVKLKKRRKKAFHTMFIMKRRSTIMQKSLPGT